MALNQVIYLPNPAAAQSKTVGIELTATGGAASTLATITASTYVRVRNFTICLTAIADATSNYVSGILKIGTGKYTVSLLVPNSGQEYTQNFSSADLGFDGTWLQGGDTITFQCIEVGGTVGSPRASVSVSLEEFTA